MNATTLQELLKAIEVHGLPEPPAGMRPGPDDMLTTTELAARLKQATRTVERWHRKGVVLGIKVDGVLMFYWPSVVARLVEKYQERDGEEGRGQKSEVRSAPPLPAALTRPPGTLSHPMGGGMRLASTPPGSLRGMPPAPLGTGRSAPVTTKRPK